MVMLGQYNRGPLWTSGYAMTETYNLTATVNMVRFLSLLPLPPPPFPLAPSIPSSPSPLQRIS